MIEFDGIAFNESISRRIMTALAEHSPAFEDLAHDQVSNRVTRYSFMAAVAQINGLPFFPKIAEFCDPSLHANCDPAVMTRGFFTPLSQAAGNKLIVAVANPWSPLAEEYLAPRFPEFEIVRRWRGEQEAKLRAEGRGGMSEAELDRFVQHYERLTRHILADMPDYADLVIRLDAERRVV